MAVCFAPRGRPIQNAELQSQVLSTQEQLRKEREKYARLESVLKKTEGDLRQVQDNYLGAKAETAQVKKSSITILDKRRFR